MDNMKKSMHVCFYYLRKWSSTYKIYIIFIILFIYLSDMLEPIRMFVKAVDVPITPWILPFIPTDWFDALILMFGMLLLFCDMPIIDESQPYLMIRSGKRPWLFGQFVYIFISGAVYTLFIFLTSIILLIDKMQFSMEWGKVIGTLAQTNAREYYQIKMLFPYNFLLSYSPIQCTLYALLLIWLCTVAVGIVVFVVNFTMKRMLGTILGAGMCLFTIFTINGSGYILYYFSPMSYLGMNHLDLNGTSPYPSIAYAICILIFIIFVFSFYSFLSLKRYTINNLESGH